MEPQSQGDEELRPREPKGKTAMRQTVAPLADPGDQARRLRRFDDDPRGNIVADGPTPREIESGANASIAFYEDATGRKFPEGAVDEETSRILWQHDVSRAGWTERDEADARMALQSLYPDVGGSKTHGPL